MQERYRPDVRPAVLLTVQLLFLSKLFRYDGASPQRLVKTAFLSLLTKKVNGFQEVGMHAQTDLVELSTIHCATRHVMRFGFSRFQGSKRRID